MRDLLSEDEDLFPVVRAADIPVDEVSSSGRWLVEDLWSARAVGILGGPPKSGKSWLALEMAVCVASGKPCLGLYPVLEKGPALVYLAEDSLHAVRERTEALADHHGVDLAALDLHVVTAPSMRLDLSRDQVRLLKTVRSLSPRLLVLDPLVRLHRLDENSAHDISGLLAYLRHLQRELDLSIILVHHAKRVARHAMRGDRACVARATFTPGRTHRSTCVARGRRTTSRSPSSIARHRLRKPSRCGSWRPRT